MTFSEILNSSKTTLYLTGRTAYTREYNFTRRTKKADFESLLENRDSVIVIVCKNTAEKYAKRINRLGFILRGKSDYSSDEYVLFYKKVKFNGLFA